MAGKDLKIHLSEEQFVEIYYLKDLRQKLENTANDIKNLLSKMTIQCRDNPEKKLKTKKYDEIPLQSAEFKCKLSDMKFVKVCELESHVKTKHMKNLLFKYVRIFF